MCPGHHYAAEGNQYFLQAKGCNDSFFVTLHSIPGMGVFVLPKLNMLSFRKYGVICRYTLKLKVLPCSGQKTFQNAEFGTRIENRPIYMCTM